jgi:adenosylhomocysteine nucleosidase
MSPAVDNRGVANFGDGMVHVSGSAIGDNATVNVGHPQPRREGTHPQPSDGCNVGVITVLPGEAKAVIEVLGLEQVEGAGKQRFYTGTVEAAERVVDVVMTRALSPGQRPVMTALENLCEQYAPAVLTLVGIGGAIHRDLTLGDVVVATRVVYYDLRKVTPSGVLHRGEERVAPAATVHSVNSFFTDHGQPAEIRPDVAAEGSAFRVLHGLIGSGEAVVADAGSEIRTYLSTYNDKVLAVDMEAGGLSQFCYETSASGWVVIRGISDHADSTKDDHHHAAAASNAAYALRYLLPYLRSG